MNPLRALETAISNLVEGTFGRVFRSEVRPMELARRLAREMDEHRTASVSRVYAPNEYAVWLSPEDRSLYEGVEGDLIDELCAYLLEHARREDLMLASSPTIAFHTDESLTLGEFGVQAKLTRPGEIEDERPGERRDARGEHRGASGDEASGEYSGARGGAHSEDPGEESPSREWASPLPDVRAPALSAETPAPFAEPSVRPSEPSVRPPEPSARPAEPPAAPGRPAPRAERGETMIYSSSQRVGGPPAQARARRATPRALLVMGGKRLLVPPPGAVLGRSRECDVVIEDSGVSRRHAEVRPAAEGWTIADLDSTNGVRVNGRAVRHRQPLELGDRIELGSTEILFEVR